MLYRNKHKCDWAFYEIVHASSVQHVNVIANVLKKELQNLQFNLYSFHGLSMQHIIATNDYHYNPVSLDC